MSYFLSQNIEKTLRDKWLLWDTSALIRIADCDADDLMKYVQGLVTENVIIKPVILELAATNDQQLGLKRAGYVQKYIGTIMKLNIDTTKDKTEQIRASLPTGSQPGAVDLMLGSTLAQYGAEGKMLFVTENIKDFAEPLYKKVGFLMVASDKRSFGLTILQMDLSKLSK